MELRIEPYKTPEQIFFNYEELKKELLQKASAYEVMVYTEDQIRDAKADRANLNHLKKALNDERIRREKEYMESFNVFKGQIAEIISIIDKPCAVIDRQIKEFEERQKEEKLEKIREFWETRILEKNGIKFEQILNPKWLNASVSMKSIEDSIVALGGRIIDDLAVLRNLPFYAFEAEQMYLSTLDLGKSVSEAHRLQEIAERKAAWEAEQERRKAVVENTTTIPSEPGIIEQQQTEIPIDRQWIKFAALLSVGEAKALKEFFTSKGIEYKAV